MAAAALAVAFAGPAHAGSMLTEMTNALKTGEGDGAEDDLVEMTLHLGGSAEPVKITGRDYQSFKIFENDGTPVKLELYHGEGSEKHNILINIAAARYYRLNVVKRAGEWHYDFSFYY
jgi:hypothetical protein